MFRKIFGFKEVEVALQESVGYDISPKAKKKRVQLPANSDGTPKLELYEVWPPLPDMEIEPPDAYVFGPGVRQTPAADNDGAQNAAAKKRAKR